MAARVRSMCGSGARGFKFSEGTYHADTRDQRHDPAEETGLTIVAHDRRDRLRRWQRLDRVQDQEKTHHPVRDPTRVVEYNRKHDESGHRHADDAGDDDTAMKIIR